jgi:cobalt-zinc-cadmium efflux system protein
MFAAAVSRGFATVGLMHAHDAQSERRPERELRALGIALVLVAGFMAAEVAGGLLAESLALLADAGHMLSDAASLLLALFAVWIARRPPTAERTFGFRRVEILAALANGVALVAIAIWIFVESIARLRDPPDPLGGWILALGAAGLAVNIAAAFVVRGARSGSLNVEAAFRHVIADALGSVAVVVAGVAIVVTGWVYADPLVSMAIGVLILAGSWSILRDSVNILLEAAPAGMNTAEIGRAMAAVDDVVEVHDLHVWTITSGFPALSAHVLVQPAADCHAKRRELQRLLADRFAIEHATLQVDHAGGVEPVELGAPFRRRTPIQPG